MLVKGLLEFSRVAGFQFTYNKIQKTFSVDIPASKRSALYRLFLVVENELQKELEFKLNLKTALAFERQYQIEKAGVYHFVAG